MDSDPETLGELMNVIDNPPYKDTLRDYEKDEMVRSWLRRHHGQLFSQEVQGVEDVDGNR